LPFQIAIRDTGHPITKGLPPMWMHQGDELYNSLRGPGENMTVLATAHSDPLPGTGTNRDEPMLMVLSYGKGRAFHTILGHDVSAMSCLGFIATFQRGTEWAATGNVTQKVPANFPTADSVSYRVDIAAMDPAFLNPAPVSVGRGGAGLVVIGKSEFPLPNALGLHTSVLGVHLNRHANTQPSGGALLITGNNQFSQRNYCTPA
jgi:hypothetical protein